MLTIQLPDEVVERLRARGVQDVEAFVTTLLGHIDDTIIAAALQPTVEKRIAALQNALANLQSDITPERWAEVSASIQNEQGDWDED